MGLESRNIEFVHEFLNFQSEEPASHLDKILRREKNDSEEKIFEPTTLDELKKRIDKSESDFRNNLFKSSNELLAKYK